MKFPIQRKTLVGFGVALVVLITINALSYWSLLRHRETDYWVAHTYQVQQKIEATLAELTEVETGQRGYLLMGEEDYLKIYNNNASLIDKQIRELEILTVDNPRQQQRINTLKPLVVRRLAALSQVIELRKKKGFEAALTGVKTSQGRQIMARIRDIFREMEDEEAALLKQRLRSHDMAGRTQSLIFSAGIVFNVVVFYWLYRTISREIVRRKRTQAALEKANEALEITVTQLLGESFTLADNIEQYQQYQGFHADGQPYAPAEWPIVRSISTGEVVTNEEINYLCGDGTYRLLSVSSTPVRNHKGQIIAGVVTFYDLTDSKRVQEELRKTLLRERELSELRSSFVSLVSHEFRTPLTTIQSSAELLERYQERLASEKKLTHYHRIQSAISQMTHLLNEVLLIGQAEAGKLQFNPQPLDLVAFCRELVEGMQVMVDNRHSGKSHAHRLSCTVSGECKDAEMDEKLLRHILTNLLSNAIKYSPDGGSVQFALIGNDNDVIFQITDSGIGIPEEDKKQLFKSFSRASNVATIQGTGLGLAIVKKSVDLHGGQITVDSVAGNGTTFTVTLPKKPC